MNKTYYDRNRTDSHYQPGDKVLTRLYGIRSKLDLKFSSTPKIVITANHPTYVVQDTQTGISGEVHLGDLRPVYID